MSQKESILWTGSAFGGYWTGKLRELRPAPAHRVRLSHHLDGEFQIASLPRKMSKKYPTSLILRFVNI
jgi:hypothetical protein